MKRDGSTKSIWQDDIEAYRSVNGWNKEDIYDALIVGGGITGITTALLLQMEGEKCILVESHNLGFGTTGGTSAHLNTILDSTYPQIEQDFGHDNAKLVATGTREAIDLIEDLIDIYNIKCDFAYKTAYLFANNEKEEKELDKIKKAAKAVGLVVSETADIPVPIPYTNALRFEFQAQFHPLKYILGLAAGYEQHGGVILQECTLHTTVQEEYITAETTLGKIRCKNIVYATHTPPGLNIMNLRCAPYRSYVGAFRLDNENYPDCMAYDMENPYHYLRTHTINGERYLIAGGYDHKTGHNDNTAYAFTALEAYVRKHYGPLTVAYQWSAQYYIPADGLPYIGLMPGEKNTFVATGFNGNGLVLGTLAAKIICSIISGKHNPSEELYSPSRIKPIAGFTNFIKENADVISMFISKRLNYDKIVSLVELAPGEARVAEWEGQKVALYKDDNGRIHALDPVCPHAKCIVTWNSAEKSWDCPCHGSRFAPNGDMLTGPAEKGLTQIQWEGIDGD